MPRERSPRPFVPPPPVRVVLLPIVVRRGVRRVVRDLAGVEIGEQFVRTGSDELRFVDVHDG